MSHPHPGYDYSDKTYRSDSPHKDIQGTMPRKKISSAVHNFPEFADLRKANQGVNATRKGSVQKSIRRHSAKHIALDKSKRAREEYESDKKRGTSWGSHPTSPHDQMD